MVLEHKGWEVFIDPGRSSWAIEDWIGGNLDTVAYAKVGGNAYYLFKTMANVAYLLAIKNGKAMVGGIERLSAI